MFGGRPGAGGARGYAQPTLLQMRVGEYADGCFGV
jgi:hypothetical protein